MVALHKKQRREYLVSLPEYFRDWISEAGIKTGQPITRNAQVAFNLLFQQIGIAPLPLQSSRKKRRSLLHRMRMAWGSPGRVKEMNQGIKEMMEEGVAVAKINDALWELLEEVRAAGADEDTEEIILKIGDQLQAKQPSLLSVIPTSN